MSRPPNESFMALCDALMRAAALDNRFAHNPEPAEAAELLEAIDQQIDLALAAWAELAIQEEALADIQAMLFATYGGRP